MISLLLDSSELKITQFLGKPNSKFRLVADPELISKIYYARRNKGEEVKLDSIIPLDNDTLNAINEAASRSGDCGIYLVADATGEANRVAQLRATYPNITFYGFMEDFLPTFLARKSHEITNLETLDLQASLDVVLLFAPPRSGSSLVADVLTDLGVGNTAEHLRPNIIECMKASYRCNWSKIVRRFLHLSAVDGWAGSKLISHFLTDYFDGSFRHALIAELSRDGHRLHPIFLYRNNVVLQAVSGYLASKRGVWHMVKGQARDVYEEDRNISYNFDSMFSRYANYKRQIANMQFLEEMFPDNLTLVYEEDCSNVMELAVKLGEYLNLPTPTKLRRAERRKKLTNALNTEFETRFKQEYRDLFARDVQ